MKPVTHSNIQGKHQVDTETSFKPMKPDFNSISPDITLGVSKNDSSFQFVIHKYEFVCIGSFVVKASRVRFWNPNVKTEITITQLGFRLSLPCAIRLGERPWGRRIITICVPVECILEMKCALYNGSIIIFLVTGIKYAAWLRKSLELDRNNSSHSSRFFCPQQGNHRQKKIVFAIKDVTFQTTHILEKFYAAVIQNIDIKTAISTLRNTVSKSDSCSLLEFLGIHVIQPAEEYPAAKTDPFNLLPESWRNIIESKKKQNCDWFYSSKNNVKNDEKQLQLKSRKKLPFDFNDESDTNTDDASRHKFGTPSDLPKEKTSCETGPSTPLDKKLFAYVGPTGTNFDIFTVDVLTLQKGEYLNDQIIDFWLLKVQMEDIAADIREKTHAFDSYFYKMFAEDLQNKPVDVRYMSVQARTKHVDIFSKDYIIIPINENFHWIVAIVCFLETSEGNSNRKNQKTLCEENERGKSLLVFENQSRLCNEKHAKSQCTGYILIFDSINTDTLIHRTICSNIREFFTSEWKSKNSTERKFDEFTLPRRLCVAPKQQNYFDCGLFLLENVEKFLTHPIQDFESEPIDLRNWFIPADVSKTKRNQIYNFIAEKVKLNFPENEPILPKLNFE